MVEREQDIENAAPLQSESNEKGGRRRESAREREREAERDGCRKAEERSEKRWPEGFVPLFLSISLCARLSPLRESAKSRGNMMKSAPGDGAGAEDVRASKRE